MMERVKKMEESQKEKNSKIKSLNVDEFQN